MPVQQPLNTPLNAADPLADHRHNHRSGTPPKIGSDPELRAVIAAIIGKMNLADTDTEVAATCPPDRRVTRPSATGKTPGQAVAPSNPQLAAIGKYQGMPHADDCSGPWPSCWQD